MLDKTFGETTVVGADDGAKPTWQWPTR